MISYPFLSDLFKSVLSRSKAIEGRFFLCPKFGVEINSDELGQVLTGITIEKKYPLALMMPPRSIIEAGAKKDWESFRCTLFFLKTTYYDSDNRTTEININTRTSQHTIPMDWHDMKRSAIGFIRMLDMLQRSHIITPRLLDYFRIDTTVKTITPVSEIGIDRATGVRLDFEASLFIGCVLEDYESEIADFVMPETDSHIEHPL